MTKIVKESLVKNIDYTHRLAENITDDLLTNGVIVPPCKVGQNGYWLISNGIRFVTFDKILTVGTEWRVRARYFVTETVYFSFDKFGKTVFLTKEEAEKALAERSKER